MNKQEILDNRLIWAGGNGQLEIVKLLLERGVDVHTNNNQALHWATLNGHLEVVQLLKSYGAKYE